jgi:peptidoglycan/xylan/chitin deacetylase (PgdA/CDA1 family)
MTRVYERAGRRYVPARTATLVRYALRRSDVLAALLDALEAHPDAMCRGCDGADGSGRAVEIGPHAWTWMSCAACRTREANARIIEASVPADS